MKSMEELAELTRHYPRFADGRIDYTSARVCPVVNCTVVCGDEVLLTYRSKDVVAYPETWNGISGFIDDLKPLDKIVRDELYEEVGISERDIEKIVIREKCEKCVQSDESIDREWHVFPVLVKLVRKPAIKTNWENKEAKWIPKTTVLHLELMPFYAETFKIALGDELDTKQKLFIHL